MARRQKIGIVVSDKMEKSIVVATETRYKHNLYGKIMEKNKSWNEITMIGKNIKKQIN